MKYRTAGLLSLGLTALAILTFYNTASTRAQPPLGSGSRNSDDHNHDHDHDGHNHSHEQAGESPTPNADAITAPFGGPPPLPTTRPAPSTNQSGAIQQGLPSPPAADLPPTLLPPNSVPGYDFQPGSYDCPNARRYASHSHRDVCPLDYENHLQFVEPYERRFTTPHIEPNHFGSHGFGASYPFRGQDRFVPVYRSEPEFYRSGCDANAHGAIRCGH